MDFQVSGTQSRPAGVPLFVLGNNNLNPRVSIDEVGVTVKVVFTAVLPWAQISRVRRKKALFTTVVELRCAGWEYLCHFREPAEVDRLLAALAERGLQPESAGVHRE